MKGLEGFTSKYKMSSLSSEIMDDFFFNICMTYLQYMILLTRKIYV